MLTHLFFRQGEETSGMERHRLPIVSCNVVLKEGGCGGRCWRLVVVFGGSWFTGDSTEIVDGND